MNSILLRPLLRSTFIILQNDIKLIPQLYLKAPIIQARFCSTNQKQPRRNDPDDFKISFNRDRSVPIPVEESIEYLQSTEFKENYKSYKIWELFRRNFPGQFSPAKPRIMCVENGRVTTSNPCVICRDEYLVLDYTNVNLLKHFISPHTGYVYPNTLICLCSEQYEKLCVAVTLAKSYGLIDFDLPCRQYDYHHHYEKLPQNFV